MEPYRRIRGTTGFAGGVPFEKLGKEKRLMIAHKPLLSNGAPGGIRTPDLQVRSLLLYPAELRALGEKGH